MGILDVDVHHGNGTQAIVYGRADVLTISIHADPARFHPFVRGFTHVVGHGAGTSANSNLPFPVGVGDDGNIATLCRARRRLRAFAPGALVLDASEKDPLACRRGYLSDVLGRNLTAVPGGCEGARRTAEPDKTPA